MNAPSAFTMLHVLLAAAAVAVIPWYGIWPALVLAGATFLELLAVMRLAGPH